MVLNPDIAEELLSRGFESPDLDYKLEFKNDTRSWMEIAKDIFGMSNFGGGYIVFGVKDGTFEQVGLEKTFHIDSQVWVDKVQKWATGNINLSYIEYLKERNGIERKFPILYVHGSIGNFVVPKVDGKYKLPSGEERIAFRKGLVYTRRNTSTEHASGDEYWELFWSLNSRTAQQSGSRSVPLEIISALNIKAQPDNIEETIWFNMFPVLELPDHIYAAEASLRQPLEVYDQIENILGSRANYDVPAFLLEDKKLYCFSPFEEGNPLTVCMDMIPRKLMDLGGKVYDKISIKEWVKEGPNRQKLVKLLNYNLKDLCWKKRFHHDPRKNRFFIRYYGGMAPEITWKPYRRTSTRKLVYPRLNKETGHLYYCEHFAGKLRFTFLGDQPYLIIEPTRVLTVDGVEPLDQRRNVKISTRRNFHYHNNNYLYDMKLWLHILAGNREEIILGHGKELIKVSITPLTSRINVGILNDQHTNEDFLDNLKSEPLEFDIITEDDEESNPLTETSIEG
ncbi:helix-turn-helix domain-containing protein [Thermoproteota archaeon]